MDLVSPRTSARARSLTLSRAAGLFAFCSILAAEPALSAEYATGGSSPNRDQVLWLTWGGGTLGTPGQSLINGSSTSATIPVAGGVDLVVTCSLGSLAGNPLQSYRPGDWSGDSLDDLYNVGGTGTANQLINGIMVSGGQATFTVTCTAALGGKPFALRGLVMADAESINSGVEYVQSTADGEWFAVEMRKNLSAGPYMAEKSPDGRTIRFGPGNDDNTAAVSFLRFNNPSSNVSMDFDMRGGGNTAIAIGLLAPYADFSDAPSSYGEVMHLVADMQFDNDNIPADGNQYNLNTAGYDPGGLAPPNNDYLGSRGPDTELEATHTPGADAESAAEEDAWPVDYTISVLQAGEQLTQAIKCTGTGTVAGWIDFNRNGTFDNPDERTDAQCSGGEAVLTWTISKDLTPGVSYVRLRYSNDASALALPTGTAPDGEVEDSTLTIVAPSLSVTKGSNAANDVWQVSEAGALYQLTVTNTGPAASGDPANGVAPAPITVLDHMPAGILPDWTGTHTSNGWDCTFAGQLVTCTTSQLIAASGTAGASLQFDLPVQVTPAALGAQTNYASVGGGRDPFNNGQPPMPGATCTDAAHCAAYVVTVQSTPAMTVDKRVDQTSVSAPATLNYTITMTNTGNVPLTNVQLADTLPNGQPATLAGPTGDDGDGELDVAEVWTYTTTYDVTQSDIDAGQVLINTATGTADELAGPVEDTAETTVQQTPGLRIEKSGNYDDADNDGQGEVGETVAYGFTVENTGNVTLADVTVNDDKVTINEGPQTLAPGTSFTFTASYVLTQNDVDAGQVENTATATGADPGGQPVESLQDEEIVPLPGEPGLALVKTGVFNDENGNSLGEAGETIAYRFEVKNIGALTLTDVVVDDPLVTINEGPQTLAVGASFTFTATFVLTQDDLDAGRVVNTAVANGTDPDGKPVRSPQKTVETPLPGRPALTVGKTGAWNDANGNGLADAGETIAYSFLVENTGTVSLTDVTVNDPAVSIDQGPQVLTPGASFTFTATHVLTQADVDAGEVQNVATATGTEPGGDPVESPESEVTVALPGEPGLAIEKTAEPEDTNGNGFTEAGEAIVYTFRIKNTGNVTISDVIPVDPGPTFDRAPGAGALSPFSPAEPVTLAPGKEQVFTARYILAQADIDAAAGVENSVSNTANAMGAAPGGGSWPVEVLSAQSLAVISLPAAASDISVAKIANMRAIRRGEQAPFTIRVTNHAGSRTDGLTVVDTIPSGFRYVEGSATVDGVAMEPEVSGRSVRFGDLSLGGNGAIEIRLRLLALSSAGPGEHVNRAMAQDSSGRRLTPVATAVVEILAEPVFDCGDIVGKVFDDVNLNGYQDQGEPGLPGVRMATVNGWLVTTDAHGRFHVACADLPDSRIGSNFIMKLDTRTLPTGYRVTTENPRVVRLTAGKMTKLNFGAALGRVVRLDLRDDAFVSGETALQPAWAAGMDELIRVLSEERSVLRLSYFGADTQLAETRIDHIKELIAERWRSRGGRYRLEIETRMEMDQ